MKEDRQENSAKERVENEMNNGKKINREKIVGGKEWRVKKRREKEWKKRKTTQ